VTAHSLPMATNRWTDSIRGLSATVQLARVRATVVGGVVTRGVVGVGAGAAVVGAGPGEGLTGWLTGWLTDCTGAFQACFAGVGAWGADTAGSTGTGTAESAGGAAGGTVTPTSRAGAGAVPLMSTATGAGSGAGAFMASAAMIVHVAARLSPLTNAREAGAADRLARRGVLGATDPGVSGAMA